MSSIRLKIQGLSKPEKIEILSQEILKYLARSGASKSPRAVAEAMGYTTQTIRQENTYLGKAASDLVQAGAVSYERWGGYKIREDGLALVEKQDDSPKEYKPLPEGASGPASEVLKDLIFDLGIPYPKLAKELKENVWVNSISDACASVSFLHTVNPDTFNAYAEKVLDRASMNVYGSPIYFNVKSELATTGESKTCLPKRLVSLVASVMGESNMETLKNIELYHEGWHISLSKDDAKE